MSNAVFEVILPLSLAFFSVCGGLALLLIAIAAIKDNHDRPK